MAKFIGRKVEAAIAFESSRGAGAAPVYSLGKVDFSVYDKADEARNEESLGHIADSSNKFITEKFAQGKIEGNLGANMAGYLMALALGTAPTIGSPTDSVYPWTIPVANTNQHKSGALLVKDGNQTILHKLVMVEQLELSIELDSLVKFSAEFISKLGVVSTQSIPTYVNDYKFGKRLAKVFIAANVAGLAAATRLSLKSAKITINKNLVRDSSIGTVQPEDILNQSMSIEGELKLNLTDQTFRNYMLDATKKAMRIQLSSEDVIGTSGRGTLTLDLPLVDFFSWEPDAGNDDIVSQTINFKANYDPTNGFVNSCIVGSALASA